VLTSREALAAFSRGGAIPAHPLALTEELQLDEVHQRALTRYYLDAGAAGLAVGVHTTQFGIHDNGMLDPVLAITADEVRATGSDAVLVAGVQGSTADAVREATGAAEMGYHLVLLRPERDLSDDDLVARAEAVGEVLPVVGFYLQPAVGGRHLSAGFWQRFASIESVVGIKAAPFDTYLTLDLLRGVCRSGRAAEVALYTGNDNHIVGDLATSHHLVVDGVEHELAFIGGLLGQWAVWTRAAVQLCEAAARARTGDDAALREVLALSDPLTDANSAIFDVAGSFRGSIAGVNEVLRRCGLLSGNHCLDPEEYVSETQRAEIDRVWAAYPQLRDDDFVAANLARWLT
jgi:dihydrodipicolinate synthase/N-acetylneuraminate lyase